MVRCMLIGGVRPKQSRQFLYGVTIYRSLVPFGWKGSCNISGWCDISGSLSHPRKTQLWKRQTSKSQLWIRKTVKIFVVKTVCVSWVCSLPSYVSRSSFCLQISSLLNSVYNSVTVEKVSTFSCFVVMGSTVFFFPCKFAEISLPPKSSSERCPCTLLPLKAFSPQCRLRRGWCCVLMGKDGYFRWNGKIALAALEKEIHVSGGRPTVRVGCVRGIHRLASGFCVKQFVWLMPVNSELIPPKHGEWTSRKTMLFFLISCISRNLMSTITLAWLCNVILFCQLISDDGFKLIKTRQCIHTCLIRKIW